jgi:hypothetical protein
VADSYIALSNAYRALPAPGSGSGSELTPALRNEADQLFESGPPQDQFPGVMVNYPHNWYSVPGGIIPPQLLPRPETPEGKMGLEIKVSVSTMDRKGIEMYIDAVLPTSQPREPETLTSAEHLKFIRNEIEVIDGNGDRGKLRWLGERLGLRPLGKVR